METRALRARCVSGRKAGEGRKRLTNIYVERALPTDPDVQWLRVAGSAELKQLTGSSGESSFLLRELEGYAKSCGYRAAWLDTRKANSHAVAFYIAGLPHSGQLRALRRTQ
jgi:hypothetical protein